MQPSIPSATSDYRPYCLADGGELVIVGNRHLDYQDKLERIFGNCELVTENKKFVILRAVKMD